MKLVFDKRFEKDLKNIKDKQLLIKLKNLITNIKKVDSLFKLNEDVKRMRSNKRYWRIRIGDYRIGLEYDGEKIIFVRILHRRDIYRYFP